MEHVHASGIALRQLVGDRTGAVRRLIVHDHHVEPVVRQHLLRQDWQVLTLVVRRDDDEHFHARNL
jgi:hypothetical protein